MITVGSVSREEAAKKFYFLQEQISGRRKAVNELTHKDPDFVFWIYPDGRLFDAQDAHIRNYPKGHRWILDDEPDYGGFLRGRVATSPSGQVIVVYCRPETLAYDPRKIGQFLDGIGQLPVHLAVDALVISDNGDIYGTIADLESRMGRLNQAAGPDASPNGGPAKRSGSSGVSGGPPSVIVMPVKQDPLPRHAADLAVLYALNFVSSADVVTWADRLVASLDSPGNDLIDLSLAGKDLGGIHGLLDALAQGADRDLAFRRALIEVHDRLGTRVSSSVCAWPAQTLRSPPSHGVG